MKTKLLIAFMFVTALSAYSFGQSVTITRKTVKYNRPRAQSDFRRTFTIEYPIVKASTPALSKKIQRAISPLTVLRIRIKEEMSEYPQLEATDFEIKYNENGVICVTHSMEGVAAYPWNVTRTVVIDARTGRVTKPADVFTDIPGLIAMIRKDQKDEIAASIIEIKKEPDWQEPNPERLFENADFKADDMTGFVVSAEGVMFRYSYGFPRILQPIEPSGQFSYTWAQIKPFIKRGGLLARIAR